MSLECSLRNASKNSIGFAAATVNAALVLARISVCIGQGHGHVPQWPFNKGHRGFPLFAVGSYTGVCIASLWPSAGVRALLASPALDQYLCKAFAQLTCRKSLRDIEACLRSQHAKLYHMGFRSTVGRNPLANANAVRDWRIDAFSPPSYLED